MARRGTTVPKDEEPYATVANGVTLLRTVVALALGCAAATGGPHAATLLLLGYAVYWLGDVADGAVARLLDQQTRRGAVLDILCDRACTCVLAVVFVGRHPEMAAPIVVFLVQFAVVDVLLSLAFWNWPIVSPNDFHVVDRRLWLWNWSPPAKALNTAGVVVAVWVGSPGVALLVALAVLALKITCAPRMARLLRTSRSAGGAGSRTAPSTPAR